MRTFFFSQGFFHKNPEKVELKTKPCRPCINFYIKSFSGSTNAVAIRSVKWMVRCYTAPRYVHLIGNKSLWKKLSVSLILHILWITLRKIWVFLFAAVFSINRFIRYISISACSIYVFTGFKAEKMPSLSTFVTFFIKVTESGYIELLWSADLSKSFSQLIVSILIFSQYFFFNRFFPVGFPHVAYIVIH